ncbi:MAG: SDR family NAD(P)-dependent oxidoreductase [Lachnospiraceae bacterium]|nr:SDR family NAD(P)-dependent oxidoreductase [Lachnospiraceae bacterium]
MKNHMDRKQKIYVHQQQADALNAYWKSQNQKISKLEDFVKQGGSISTELNQVVEEFQRNGMTAYEQLMRGQQVLLSCLAQTQGQGGVEKSSPWANEVIDSIDLNDPETIKRREVQITLCDDVVRGESALPESGIILMLGEEDAYGTAMKKYLEAHGLNIRHIPDFLDEEEAEKQVAAAAQEGEIAGLVVLGNKYYSDEERDHYYDYILTIATLIKRVVIHIRAQKTNRQWLFLFNTFMDGKLGMTGTSEYYHYGTLSGMAKCIAIELRGQVYVKEIDFDPAIETEVMIEYLDDELRCHEAFQEVGRTADGRRHRLTSVLTKSVVTENLCPLKEEDILLVSGGSRGVTSSCIIELAKRVKCTFVILGRAEILEENNDDEETAEVSELKDMKTLMAKRFKAQGYKGAFTAIEKKARAVLAQRDMLNTFEAIRATGNRVHYYACDVNDRDGMKDVLARIQKEVGKITGVVHGAGIVADSKIWNKDMKSFRRVFDTKYKGLNNIMDNVDKEALKLLVMFSSLSGYFGNDGQIDYVAGNEYMDKYAYYMREKYPNCRAVAINWGAWNGGMMYLDAVYISTLKEKGYILIPLEVGANYFANDFLMGLPSAQILINNTGNPPV